MSKMCLVHHINGLKYWFSFSIYNVQGPNGSQVPQSKYAELLAIIEELGKEIRPTYAGSKSAMERLKRGLCALLKEFFVWLWILLFS